MTTFFFSLMRGGRIQIPLLAGYQWPNIECLLGSFVIFQGIRTSIAKEPYIFVIFQGGGDPDTLAADPENSVSGTLTIFIIIFSSSTYFTEGRRNRTSLEKQWTQKGPIASRGGSVPVFLRSSIASCGFPGVGFRAWAHYLPSQ